MFAEGGLTGAGLGWAGLGWAGLGWTGLGWAGLHAEAAGVVETVLFHCRSVWQLFSMGFSSSWTS